jgi:hypothetical protein
MGRRFGAHRYDGGILGERTYGVVLVRGRAEPDAACVRSHVKDVSG